MRQAIAAALLLGLAATARAQDGYKAPPKEIQDIVLAPPTPQVNVDPTRRRILLVEHPPLQGIEELSRPEARLAGLRINPSTNGPSRGNPATGLVFMDLATRAETRLEGLPEGARLANISWSPDGERLAFGIVKEDRIELWFASVAEAKAHGTKVRLNDAIGTPYEWLPDSRSVVARTVPEDRGAPPQARTVPQGPSIEETRGRKAPARTYQDLLKSDHDEALFEHLLTTQVVRVAADGTTTKLGSPALIERSSPSPDGKYLLVETIHRPFSRRVPVGRFPNKVEVWDAGSGKVVKLLAELPLREEVPIAFSAVAKGPRGFGWRADAPATLAWVEAQDGGDPKTKAEVRDAVFLLAAPFEGEPRTLVKLALRFAGLAWGRGDLALVTESWWETRKTKTWLVQPDNPEEAPRIVFDRSYEDRYSDPGTPLLKRTPAGDSVILAIGPKIYLHGEGASPEGNRPFLDERDLATGESKRLFRSEPPHHERVVAALDADVQKLLVARESPTEPTNYFVKAGKDETQLTKFPHPTPALKDVKRELVRYQRADGVKLNARLYVPPGWTPEKGRLPVLLWVYPAEFRSADAAGQISDSPHRFTRVGGLSPLLYLLEGYAILDNPTMPIVGEGDRKPNDTYVEQLVASARAAIDELDKRGVVDRERVAIGGHSYGAFTTANLLAHSDLFRAGIARSGAYNRTLTPFGFQGEERTLWEAPDLYAKMSPYNFANKIDEPLLLIHGEADNNAGTFPMQSERLYQAMKGNGGTARLVLLPHESHGYQARESVLHVHWETLQWLDKHVKNAKPRAKAP